MDATSIMEFVKEAVTTEVFGVWFLIGAALVFFMQAGFAMVETGFTRAKNAGNIIMKNLVFCATAATIVSGTMAERTKFVSYCIYSGVISLLSFPNIGREVSENE